LPPAHTGLSFNKPSEGTPLYLAATPETKIPWIFQRKVTKIR
jgi:hypothetical protein